MKEGKYRFNKIRRFSLEHPTFFLKVFRVLRKVKQYIHFFLNFSFRSYILHFGLKVQKDAKTIEIEQDQIIITILKQKVKNLASKNNTQVTHKKYNMRVICIFIRRIK